MRTHAIVMAVWMLLARCAPADAGPAEVAAALPDEASECRYLLDLCKRADAESSALAQAAKMIEVGKAAQVIRAKHERMPACFRDCTRNGGPMLDLSRFE